MLRMAVLLLIAATSGIAKGSEPHFLIEMELWLHGEQHGVPIMVVEADNPASVEQSNGDTGWRVDIEVEKPAAYEQAPGDALWLHVGVHEKIDGEWDLLADSILGVPEGQPATMTVVEGEVSDPSPENSIVYLRATTSRLQPGEVPAD